MGVHATHLGQLNNIIQENEIKNGSNINKLFSSEIEHNTKFKNQ